MNALTHADLRSAAPCIFATSPWRGVSRRYRMVPTIDVVNLLGDQGFVPVRAQQSTCRLEGKAEFTKHMIRFRRNTLADREAVGVGGELPELVLVNAHDGSTTYNFLRGVFRVLCLNGLVSNDTENEEEKISVRHAGGSDFSGRVIDATYRVMEQSERAIATANTWKQIELGEPQQIAFATAALTLKDDPAIRPGQLLVARRTEDQQSPDGTRDLWRTMNVVQEHLVRGGDRGYSASGRRTRTRAIKSVDSDLRTNKALWTLATEMARLAK
jgi:Domain of unknown function (DUF932)